MRLLAASESVVLTLLTDQAPSYGLELVTRSGGRLTRGGIYVILGRMEDKGLVTSRPADGGRRLYEPTALGHRALLATRFMTGELPVEGLVP